MDGARFGVARGAVAAVAVVAVGAADVAVLWAPAPIVAVPPPGVCGAGIGTAESGLAWEDPAGNGRVAEQGASLDTMAPMVRVGVSMVGVLSCAGSSSAPVPGAAGVSVALVSRLDDRAVLRVRACGVRV